VRRHRLLDLLSTVIVMSMGLVTLIGLLSKQGSAPSELTAFTLQLVTVVAAIAILIGLLNLIAVHLGRFVRSEYGWPYSLIALIAALIVGILRILDRAEVWSGDLEGEQISVRVFEAVQVSLESALAAMLLFFLVYAAYRLMRRQVTIWNFVFSLTVVIVLLGSISFKDIDVFNDTRDWLERVPANAGARGILIGVGLGTVVAGIRVLVGQDRSYRG
jgi:hypothetical protein